MIFLVKKFFLIILRKLGIEIFVYRKSEMYNGFPVDRKFFHKDFSSFETKILTSVRDFTMTSPERVISLIHAVSYLSKNKIFGNIVECGVWRGGSMMTVAKTLIENNDLDRDLFLCDTFDGMPSPDPELDTDLNQVVASEYMSKHEKSENDYIWAFSQIEKVKANMMSTGYDTSRIHYLEGLVENTLPDERIQDIALLRLDTDFYSSTAHEMNILFPKLVKGGVLIIDDYGHWGGARKAVDYYLIENAVQIHLVRIDYSCRIGIKF